MVGLQWAFTFVCWLLVVVGFCSFHLLCEWASVATFVLDVFAYKLCWGVTLQLI